MSYRGKSSKPDGSREIGLYVFPRYYVCAIELPGGALDTLQFREIITFVSLIPHDGGGVIVERWGPYAGSAFVMGGELEITVVDRSQDILTRMREAIKMDYETGLKRISLERFPGKGHHACRSEKVPLDSAPFAPADFAANYSEMQRRMIADSICEYGLSLSWGREDVLSYLGMTAMLEEERSRHGSDWGDWGAFVK
jgi:hypothetical protein